MSPSPADLLAGIDVGELLEPEPVGDLMQEHHQQVVLPRRRVGIEAVVPEAAGQASGLADLRIEAGSDVGVRRTSGGRSRNEAQNVHAGAPAGQGRSIPDVRELRSRKERRDAAEVAEDEPRTCGPQRRGRRRARERLHAGQHRDRCWTVEFSSPEIGGALEDVQTLLAEGRSRIATHWRNGCRVVEPHARGVVVDEDDRRAREGG